MLIIDLALRRWNSNRSVVPPSANWAKRRRIQILTSRLHLFSTHRKRSQSILAPSSTPHDHPEVVSRTELTLSRQNRLRSESNRRKRPSNNISVIQCRPTLHIISPSRTVTPIWNCCKIISFRFHFNILLYPPPILRPQMTRSTMEIPSASKASSIGATISRE